MTFQTTKKILMTCAALTVMAAPAMANDLIDNNSFGYIGGDVFQDASGYENELTIEVGSIAASDNPYFSGAMMNNRAEGHVEGNIFQEVHGDGLTPTISVGSIRAMEARDNTARGYVGGDIQQVLHDRWTGQADAEITVGSITAENGVAFNNNAEGYVEGSVTQFVGERSKATLRVGSQTAN